MGRPRRRLLVLAGISLFALGSITLALPKPSYANGSDANNDLYLVGEHCHDLHDITYDFSIGTDGRCHDGNGGSGWEEVLNSNLGCSNTLFYRHPFTDPHDPTHVTKTLWYTKLADFKDCWEKAQNMYNAMTDPKGDCAITYDGSSNNSKCVDYQNKLHNTLGCDSSMFQTADGNGKPDPSGKYWIIKPTAAKDCQNHIDAVGNMTIKVIQADGTVGNSPQIKDKSVPDLSGGSPSGGGDATLSCDASSNPLSWVLCPVINDVLVPAISLTDSIITQQMIVPSNQIFCGSSNPNCAAYYSAWASFRNLALGLLAIAGLVVVIAQAIGMEILDAYTIRKMLPRVLIAAVAITLSWVLMNFAVTLSNNLGFGVRDLIIAPFHNLSSVINFNFVSGSDAGSTALNFLLGGAAGVAAIPIWIAAGGIGVLLSYVATAGLAVLVAILVLILRQIAITLLVILSPVALIAYVLPNTQRVYKMWWESFSRALLMFPLIAGFIAAGRVFAAISLSGASASGGGIDAVVHDIAGFIAYFGPYFAIPLTFSMAGSMMGGIGSMINQRAGSVQGLLGNYRKGQAQQRLARARAKGLYREGFGQFTRPFARDENGNRKKTSVGKMLNTVGFWTVNADEQLPMWLGTTDMKGMKPGKAGIPGFRRGGHAMEARIKRANRDQTVKAVQDLDIGYKSGRLMAGQFQYYYDSLDAQHQAELDNNFGIKDPKTGQFVGWRAPNSWGERNQVADIFDSVQGDGIKQTEAREAAGELRGVASEFEKYTGSAETNRVDGRLLGMLSAAKAGRLELEDVANNYNNLSAGGDQESAIRETTLLQDALTHKRVSAARGHGLWWGADGQAHSSYEDPTSSKAQTSLMRINTQEIAGSKSEDVDALRETLVAGAAPFQTYYDKHEKKVMPKLGKNGAWIRKDPNSLEGKRAKEIQGRIKQLALYNYGDSDVGRKVRDIWVDRLGLDEGELEWGRGRGSAADADVAGMAGGAPGEPPPEAQGQGG